MLERNIEANWNERFTKGKSQLAIELAIQSYEEKMKEVSDQYILFMFHEAMYSI